MEASKKKILIVHNYYQIPGGEDTVVANEKRLLEEHGHEVVLYTRNNSELKTMSKLRKLMLPITTIYNPGTARDVKKIIRQQKIDVVHVHNTLNLISPSVYYAALRCGVPVVQTIHNFRLLCPGATFFRDGRICEECLEKGLSCAVKHKCYRGSRVQTLACVVSTVLHRMTGIYGRLHYICLTEFNREKITRIPNILREKTFIKPNYVPENGLPVSEGDRENRFIFLGRLEELKGIRLLLEAWRHLGPEAPELMVCGTGPLEGWCRSYLKENGLTNVKLMGFVPNQEAIRLVGESKALVLPTQCYEGFPMSIAEAYSVGTPVLTGDMGNAGSLVTERVTGMKYAYDSPEALAQTVERFEKETSVNWAENTRRVYLEKLTPEMNYRQLIQIYSRVCGE